MTEKNFLGEVWIGLDKLHQLTSARSYSLKITMTDYDGKKYTALFEQFQVNSFSVLVCSFSVNYFCIQGQVVPPIALIF